MYRNADIEAYPLFTVVVNGVCHEFHTWLSHHQYCLLLDSAAIEHQVLVNPCFRG